MPTKDDCKMESPGQEVLLGAHMSIAGGLPQAVRRAQDVGATALQLFVKNPTQWRGRSFDDAEVEAFRRGVLDASLRTCVAHGSYLLNLASPAAEVRRKSVDGLADEWKRAGVLGLDWLVLHPGSHGGEGERVGLERVAEGILAAVERSEGAVAPLALESTAGQGNTLGYCFEHLRDLLGRLDGNVPVGVCLDTCHLFAAGYDLRDDEARDRVFAHFEALIGSDRLAVWHLNDNKQNLGSHVDRHEHIGRGRIGLAAFRDIMRNPAWTSVAKIIETPKGDGIAWDRRNLDLLRRLAGSTEDFPAALSTEWEV